MSKIIGIIVVFASVLGGFLLSGGKIGAIIQPFEVLIIGGAALGAFLQSNPGSTFMVVLKKAPKMFSNRFTQTYYLEVLGMLYEILNKSRREGMMAIEADIEDPAASPIFSKYPGVLKDERMTAYVCDYLRIMSSGNMAPHELEGLFDMELSSLKEDLEHPSHAVTKVADALPGFGIVAAVLGIVITMALLGEGSQAEIGFVMVNNVQLKEFRHTTNYKNLEFHLLGKDTWYLNVGPHSPFYDRKEVYMEDLLDSTFIRLPDDYFSNLAHYLKIGGIPLGKIHRRLYVSDSAAILALLRQTDVIRFGPALSAPDFAEYGIRSIPVRNSGVEISIGWIQRKRELLTPEAEEFVGLLKGLFPSPGAADPEQYPI